MKKATETYVNKHIKKDCIELLVNGYTEEQIATIFDSKYETIEQWENACNDTVLFEKCNTEGDVVFTYNKSYIPVFCMVYKFVRKQKTKESKDVLLVTKNGCTVPTQNYYDYINEIYYRLLKVCKDIRKFPNLYAKHNNFSELLYVCTIYGLLINWNNNYHWLSRKVKDRETGKIKRIRFTNASITTDIDSYTEYYTEDTEENTANNIENSLPVQDKTPKSVVENSVVSKEYINGIMEYAKSKPNIARYLRLRMKGYKYADIAKMTNGKTDKSIIMALKRFGKDLEKLYNKPVKEYVPETVQETKQETGTIPENVKQESLDYLEILLKREHIA